MLDEITCETTPMSSPVFAEMIGPPLLPLETVRSATSQPLLEFEAEMMPFVMKSWVASPEEGPINRVRPH
jgi:hypothetical protein